MMGAATFVLYIAAFFGIFSSLIYLMALYENKGKFTSPKPKKIYKVSIVIPAFNEQGRIRRTMRSLLKLNYPKKMLEIILVDDGSTDGTLKEMKQYVSSMVKVYHKKNGGKASALNYGIKRSVGEIIVSLDADSFVDKNALKNMIGYFNNPKCMSVTPSMKIWKPKSFLQKIQFVEYMFGIFLRKAASFLGCIHVTPGPFSAYRKSFFKKYGGYQEGNLTEDIEVALRIQSNNYIIENAPDAYSYTVGPSRFKSLLSQRIRWYLGFINNVWDYKHLFSYKYGFLGLFYLPSAFLSVFFAIFLVGYSIKLIAGHLYTLGTHLFSINFDFTKVINFDLFYFSPNLISIIMLVAIIFATIVVVVARRISNDKEKILFPYLISVLFYGPLYALWWGASIAYKLGGKTIKWSGVEWEKD